MSTDDSTGAEQVAEGKRKYKKHKDGATRVSAYLSDDALSALDAYRNGKLMNELKWPVCPTRSEAVGHILRWYLEEGAEVR